MVFELAVTVARRLEGQTNTFMVRRTPVTFETSLVGRL